MKLSKYALGLVLSAVSLTAWAAETPSAATLSSAEQILAEAQAANAKAASVGHEWRDTAQILEQAQEALSKGDYARSVQLAEQARLFGEAGYQQALSQQNAGPRF